MVTSNPLFQMPQFNTGGGMPQLNPQSWGQGLESMQGLSLNQNAPQTGGMNLFGSPGGGGPSGFNFQNITSGLGAAAQIGGGVANYFLQKGAQEQNQEQFNVGREQWERDFALKKDAYDFRKKKILSYRAASAKAEPVSRRA